MIKGRGRRKKNQELSSNSSDTSTVSTSNEVSHTTTHHMALTLDIRNNIIREILEFVHDHFRFMLNRHGLGHHTDHRPARLSIHAILNARLMSEYKDVLLSQSLREKIWPIVESINQYNDIVPWLLASRCPYMYNAETMKTANVYGVYRWDGGEVYDGDWLNGMANGQGKLVWPDGGVYEGEWKDGMRDGQGKNIYADGEIYEGEWRDDERNGQGTYIYASGAVVEGRWKYGRSGQGKMV